MTPIESAAGLLREATRSGVPTAPIRDVVGTPDDIGIAYAVQAVNNDLAVVEGRQPSGYKIGLTNALGQEFFGVSEPTSGVLFADARVPDGDVVACRRLLQPRLEGEVAVVLGADLDQGDLDQGDLDVADVAAAVDHLVAAIEIVDTRIADWNLTIVDMVADNMASGLYVLGSTALTLDELGGVDALAEMPMAMLVDGEQRSSGSGAGCLGNPLHAVVWLANEMVRRRTPLRAGACIMTGALGPIIPMPHTSTIRADFGPLGSVTTSWAARDADQ